MVLVSHCDPFCAGPGGGCEGTVFDGSGHLIGSRANCKHATVFTAETTGNRAVSSTLKQGGWNRYNAPLQTEVSAV
jgi:hypothetical protein